MTSEEIRQEAEEHCNEVMCTVCENKTCTERKIKCREWRDRCAGYYCGAEPREKRIAELKQENKDLADCNSRLLSQAAAATKRVIQQEKENAELKAGRPQWHDLQKDPNDLPKVGVQVLSEKGTLVIYKGVGFNWVEYSPNADNIKLRKWEEPIAWCEIPTFDKE